MGHLIKDIEVVAYNAEWKNEFEKIESMINSFIGDLIIGIEFLRMILWNIIFMYALKMEKDIWSILPFEIICVLMKPHVTSMEH